MQAIMATLPEAGGGQVYVTVNTTNGAFPDVSYGQQQVILSKLGPLQAEEETNTLDALANVASACSPVNTNKLVCGDCDFTFGTDRELFDHWLERHCRPQEPRRKEEPELQLEQCATCNLVFVRGTQRYLDHTRACTGPLPANKRKAASACSKRKWCEDSKRGSSHLGGRPSSAKRAAQASAAAAQAAAAVVSCGICSADVKTITSFFLHWLDVHHQIEEVLEEVWQCGQCRPSKLFPSSDRLREHMLAGHPVDKSKNVYQCGATDCGAMYATMDEANRHADLHAWPAADCTKCGDHKEVEMDLALHVRDYHEVTCELCGCRVDSETMKAHLVAEHGFENVWNRKSSLNRVVGKENNSSGKDKKAMTQQEDNNNGQNVGGSKCAACGLTFSSDKLLERHYAANHEFQCKFCDLVMDKDVYGAHLRGHLASERKRAAAKSKSQ